MYTYKAAPDVDVVTSTASVAGFGNLAINAFVIHAAEPVLVDTGAVRKARTSWMRCGRLSTRPTFAGSG